MGMRCRLCHAPVSPTLYLLQKMLLPGACARCSPHCFPESTELSRTFLRLPFLQTDSYKRPSLHSAEQQGKVLMHTCVGIFPSSPQTLLCRDCRWCPSSLSLTLSSSNGQADTSERGLCLARALRFLPLPCYSGYSP